MQRLLFLARQQLDFTSKVLLDGVRARDGGERGNVVDGRIAGQGSRAGRGQKRLVCLRERHDETRCEECAAVVWQLGRLEQISSSQSAAGVQGEREGGGGRGVLCEM